MASSFSIIPVQYSFILSFVAKKMKILKVFMIESNQDGFERYYGVQAGCLGLSPGHI
jgi:hypothetical protein